jgi:hypothetical protein
MRVSSLVLSVCLYLLLEHEDVEAMTIDKAILNAAPRPEMFDAFHIMGNGEVMVMTELDLLLTLDQYRKLHTPSNSRETRKAVRDISVKWTNCQVFYEITESLNTSAVRGVIRKAMEKWEKYSCLRFIESNTAKSRIQFMDGGGCYSQLGRQAGPQPLALALGCRNEGIIIHEIGHAIGWIHEHMRPDRDTYIYVNEDVVPQMYKPNFVKYNTQSVNTYNIDYDYTSIMHYGDRSLPGSITTLDRDYQSKIGQRVGMTFKDIKLANVMYDCARVMGCEPKNCSHNGFVFFRNHTGPRRCDCWCDSNDLTDPLVLCSQIDKENEKPDLKPVVNPVIPLCYDVREDCGRLINNDRDICMTKMKMMMSSCSKTCKFCGKGKEICMDHEKACPILAATDACKDKGMEPIMEKLCRASCRLCKASEPCEMQNELMGTGSNRGSGVASAWLLVLVVAGLSVSLLG